MAHPFGRILAAVRREPCLDGQVIPGILNAAGGVSKLRFRWHVSGFTPDYASIIALPVFSQEVFTI